MKKYPTLVLLLFTIIYNLFSQADTVYIVKTDTVFVTEKQDIMYKMFVENKEPEIKHLWKMNFANIGLIRPNITFEKKLVKSLSVETYISYGLQGCLYRRSEINNDFGYYALEFEQLFKHYYNLKRRERLGKKTNGFSGNYLALSFWFNKGYYTETNTNTKDIENYNLGLKQGIQRRIGNIGYVELYLGLYYRWGTKDTQTIDFPFNSEPFDINSSIVPVIGIKAGFAIDSKENLKRLIKN